MRLATSVAVGLLLIVSAAAAAEEAHLLRWADVHGDRIVFTYEDDLWVVSSAGGEARAHRGRRVIRTISLGCHRRMRGPNVPVPRQTMSGMPSTS